MSRYTTASGEWRLEAAGRVRVVRCCALDSLPAIGHAFSTRIPQSHTAFDNGSHALAEAGSAGYRQQLASAAGLAGQPIQLLRQVHGARIWRSRDLHDAPLQSGDGLVALVEDRPRNVLGVSTADCVPVLIADREGRALAAVHAGWRGTVERIVPSAIGRLERLGLEAQALLAVLGPAIGGCCYEVAQELSRSVAQASGVEECRISTAAGPAKRMLDLRSANRFQLLEAGLAEGSIHSAPWCTCCSERLFFSHRRNAGDKGRMLACIGWQG